jgi:hypothetical protein
MTTSPAPPPAAAAPSPATLARTTAVSVLVAALLLVTIVLPAEYGIDPLGTGRALGLTDIASPPLAGEAEPPKDAALAPVVSGPLAVYPAGFKVDAYEIALGPYEYVEYKYRLEKDATLLYSWSASAPVLHDMHGERAEVKDGVPPEQSFDKQSRREASGSLAAPFAGVHGWYWENPGGETVTIRLTSAGYYTSAVEIRSDRSRHPRQLRSLDALGPPVAPPAGSGSQP